MCCKLLAIAEIEKPQQAWCPDCSIGTGCKIYNQRPEPCRQFYCQYRKDPGLGEEWAPRKSKIIVDFEPDNDRLAIHVDESRRSGWRSSPYYERIMQWVRSLAADGKHVLVWEGKNAIVVLPTREINLGKIGPNRDLIVEKRATPTGPVIVDVRLK